MTALRPSDIQIPVFYPNADPRRGAGMDQGDFTGTYLRSIRQLLEMPTFNRLEPEFQRRYVAMCVGAWVEAALLCGVGTGWRDWNLQMQNHLAYPKQFAHPMYSLHMNRGKYDVAYAIDTVPYDVLTWAHANCARFGINFLDHIPHEVHHCQPIELPNGGSQFNDMYADRARAQIDLPYLRTLRLSQWLEANAPITVDGAPAPVPSPNPPIVPQEDELKIYIGRSQSGPTKGQILKSLNMVFASAVPAGAEGALDNLICKGILVAFNPQNGKQLTCLADAPDLGGAWVGQMGTVLD